MNSLKKTKINKKAVRARKTPTKADDSRKYELIGIAFATIGVISLCGLLGLNVGFVGLYFAKGISYLFGIGAGFTALLIMLIGIQYITKHHGIVYSTRFLGLTALYVSVLAIYHHFVILPGAEIMPASLPQGGGLIGGGVLFIIRKFFGVDGGIIVLGAGVLGSILLSTTWSLAVGMLKTKRQAKEGLSAAKETVALAYDKALEVEGRVQDKVREKVKNSFYNQEEDTHFTDPVFPEMPEKVMAGEKNSTEYAAGASEKAESESLRAGTDKPSFTIEYSAAGDEKQLAAAADLPAGSNDESIDGADIENYGLQAEIAAEQPAEEPDKGEPVKCVPAEAVIPVKPYKLPRVKEILSKHVKQKNVQLEREIAEKAKILATTLENFNVKAKIINACHGPAVTRYELEPAPGVKVSKITNLADDLALSLAAFSVRIEPIPGKAAIGIEVPNKELEGVQLRDVLENDAFVAAKSKLTVGLGMDIGGQAIFADLAKMPHLLVAGATGSGKSVCINTLITSILFKAKPDEVKFILIDPKMVELSNYNGIPHLMVPVVTDAKKAASVLNWAVQEMEKRYAKFAEKNVRDMERYNRGNPEEKMPAVVIIIDELADLMMVAPHDVEDAICRLAQKARAAGLHLVLATQRPSVDVITGIIKANIPSRISFSVSSQIDSRTILDMGGAEKLLGKGDMLFYPVGAAKPRRVQGAFVSDQEVEMLLEFIRHQGQEAETNEEIITFTENAAKENEKAKDPVLQQDELLEDAVSHVLSTGQASSSSIQRRFRIGYTRAARLVDTMEELHIVGPNAGSKPRDILMDNEQAMQTLKNTRT